MVNDGENVKTNKILAEWDPYTLPIISEKNGGNISIDNLIIQCKTCNVKQGAKNINEKNINNIYLFFIALFIFLIRILSSKTKASSSFDS